MELIDRSSATQQAISNITALAETLGYRYNLGGGGLYKDGGSKHPMTLGFTVTSPGLKEEGDGRHPTY